MKEKEKDPVTMYYLFLKQGVSPIIFLHEDIP